MVLHALTTKPIYDFKIDGIFNSDFPVSLRLKWSEKTFFMFLLLLFFIHCCNVN